MVNAITGDIIPLLQELSAVFQVVARANFVDFRFETEVEKWETSFQPERLIGDLNLLLCRVITYTPQNYEVILRFSPDEETLQFAIQNTGPYLGTLPGLLEGTSRPVSVAQPLEGGTYFHVKYSRIQPAGDESRQMAAMPPFFQKFHQTLREYSANMPDLEKAARAQSEREGVFLQKVNALLIANLGQEDYDVEALSKSLAMSRTQLYRRLTPLVKLSPSQYIRFVRLAKAREYLESNDWTIGEIGFRVGFKDASHFTRVFRQFYGVRPSEFRKK